MRVAALYRFCRVAEPEALRKPLAAFCCGRGIKGTLLLAHEGINGTVAGSPEAIGELMTELERIFQTAIEVKYSSAATMPFHRMKVRLKKEIVTMGVENIDPLADAGAYVEPADWNALITAPDVAVIDTRNDYEVGIGTFAGAVNPNIRSFREFPDWWRANAAAFAGKLSLLSSEGPVVLSCVSGRRSGDAIRALEPLLGTTMHLEGGLLAWGATGFPMCYPEPHGPPVHDLAQELRSAFLAELVELALDRDDLDPMAAYERIHAATGVRPGEVTARTPLTTRRTLVDRAAATLRALGGDSERIGAFVLRLFPMR